MPASPELHFDGHLWMAIGNASLGGHGRMRLLQLINELGSISQAAKTMQMSYKAAWDAVDAMNNLAGEPLVARMTGGKGGGGTQLTARGQRLVATYRLFEQEHKTFMQHLSDKLMHFDPDMQLIGRLGVRTSARNQLFGSISAIHQGAINDEIELTLPGGQRLRAVITHDSADALGLHVGGQAIALIKASWIMLAQIPDAADGMPHPFSADNCLACHITRITPGAVNAEVTLSLAAGSTLTAMVSLSSAHAMALQENMPICALFQASSVILGIPA